MFEREVCVALSRWIDPELPEKPRAHELAFRRRSTALMPLVGHWHGQGDLLHRPDLPHAWPFCVECKNVEGWELEGLFRPKWPVWQWWEQASAQADRVGLWPLLVFTRRFRPLYTLLAESVARCLEIAPKNGPVLRLDRHGERITLALLDDLTAAAPARLDNVSLRKTSSRSSLRAPASPSRKRATRGSSRSR